MDSESVCGNDKTKLVDRISFSCFNRKFSLREIILGGVVALFAVLFVVFACLYGLLSTDHKTLVAEHEQLHREQCVDRWCFETFAHMESFLNASHNPCDDFYKFACDGYRVERRLNPFKDTSGSVLRDVAEQNRVKLMNLLEQDIEEEFQYSFSFEQKTKQFYQSCLDDMARQKLGARPLIKRINELLGGWYVLNENGWKGGWDFNTALKRVRTDFWVDAFFRVFPDVDPDDRQKLALWLSPGGQSLHFRWWTYTASEAERALKLYTKYMGIIANLVARDANIRDAGLTQRVEEFVNDVFNVETMLASLNVMEQVTYMFNTSTPKITGNTTVIQTRPTYMTMLGGMLSTFADRKLHNYLIWRILETYSYNGDLSYEYFHADRELRVALRTVEPTSDLQKRCFANTLQFFETALNVLFVQTHLDQQDKVKVTSITNTVKETLENMLPKNTWMDEATWKYAVKKIQAAKYRLGYPDWYTLRRNIDKLYQYVTISPTDYFNNVLQGFQQVRREMNQFQTRRSKDLSTVSLLGTSVDAIQRWNEVYLPAGILQFPIYERDMPHYYTFGSVGTLVAQSILELIDGKRGMHFDTNGDFMWNENQLGWWSNATNSSYAGLHKCVEQFYNESFVLEDSDRGDAGGLKTYLFVPDAMVKTSGIRLAYNAYQSWVQKHGQDPYPPAFKYSPEQIFFIAHAQLYCDDRYDNDVQNDWYSNNDEPNNGIKVNQAMKQLPEFAKAFSCKPTDNMVSEKSCTYYV